MLQMLQLMRCLLYWQFTIPADATLIFDIQLLSMQWIQSYELMHDFCHPAARWIANDLKELHSAAQLLVLWFDLFNHYDCVHERLSAYTVLYLCQNLNSWPVGDCTTPFAMFVQILESRGIQNSHFPGPQSHGIRPGSWKVVKNCHAKSWEMNRCDMFRMWCKYRKQLHIKHSSIQ